MTLEDLKIEVDNAIEGCAELGLDPGDVMLASNSMGKPIIDISIDVDWDYLGDRFALLEIEEPY
jgi:hypothetical protein